MNILVHAGAGSVDRVNDYTADSFSKIIIVEPAAKTASALSAGLVEDARISVVHGALASSNGEADMLFWNIGKLCSQKEATPLLRELLPGLRLVSRERAPLMTPAALLSSVGAASSEGAVFTLVLECAGEEQDVLEAWKADGLLEQTASVQARIAEDSIFKGGPTRAVIEEWLVAEGFLVSARDMSDSDWPVLTFQADVAGKALKAAQVHIGDLEASLAERNEALKAAEARAAGTEQELTDAKTALEARGKTIAERDEALKAAQGKASSLEQELTDAKAALEESNQTLAERDQALKTARDKASSLEQELTDAKKALEASNQTLAERDQALKTARDKASSFEQQLTETKTALEAKSKTLAERDEALKATTDRKTQLEREVASDRAELEARSKALAEAEASLKTAQERAAAQVRERDKAFADLGVAMRMQGLLQSDLSDLRSRLQAAEKTRAGQEALLRKLTPRLQQAADQLRHLQLLDAPQAEASLSIGTTRSAAKAKAASSARRKKAPAKRGSNVTSPSR